MGVAEADTAVLEAQLPQAARAARCCDPGHTTLYAYQRQCESNGHAAAIQMLEDYHTKGRKIAVLGDMLELGEREAEYHRTHRR